MVVALKVMDEVKKKNSPASRSGLYTHRIRVNAHAGSWPVTGTHPMTYGICHPLGCARNQLILCGDRRGGKPASARAARHVTLFGIFQTNVQPYSERSSNAMSASGTARDDGKAEATEAEMVKVAEGVVMEHMAK